VLIDVPKDVQIAKCEYEPKSPAQKAKSYPAKDERIEQAAECINNSKKPYIYFGGGLITAKAQEEMLTLAEKLDAPIGCSLMGISGIETNHPRFLGMQGMHGHFASSMATQAENMTDSTEQFNMDLETCMDQMEESAQKLLENTEKQVGRMSEQFSQALSQEKQRLRKHTT
jgi:glyoxylate carboligase